MSTAAVQAGVTTWQIDPTHTHVEFAVRHLMISTVKGRFGEVTGTVRGDDANPASASIEVVIQTASVDTRQADRDAHLRSADFFDVERFPVITFRSTRIEPAGEGELRVSGNLTIRGVTKEVALAVTSEGRTRDPWGGERAGFSATGKVNRKDFGLTWNLALETGGFVVGDDVKISIDAELVKVAE